MRKEKGVEIVLWVTLESFCAQPKGIAKNNVLNVKMAAQPNYNLTEN